MVSLLLSLSFSITSTLPIAQLAASSNTPVPERNPACPLTCQQYGDKDPHGPDPHGKDPHDENHSSSLPANAREDERTATDNVYGTDKYGVNSQHPLDNFR